MNKDILISGAYGEANIGDDMLLYIIIKWLKANNIKSNISITSPNIKYMGKMYSNVNIVSRSHVDFLDPKLFILGGGTQFFSFINQDKSNNEISLLRIAKNIARKVMIFPKRINYHFKKKHAYTKKIALGIGIGPFETYGSEVIAESRLLEYDYIYPRDIYTESLCKKFQIPSLVGADICLSDYFHHEYNFKHHLNNLERKRIGVVLRSWDHSGTGEILNNKVLQWVESNKATYDISLFLFSIDKDLVLKELVENIEDIQIEIWNPEQDNFENYLTKISVMDIMITSRYHAAIFSLNFNVPTVCLGIEPKLKHLADEVEGFYYFHSNNDSNVIDQFIGDIFENYTQIQENMEGSRLKLNQRANLIMKDAERYLNI